MTASEVSREQVFAGLDGVDIHGIQIEDNGLELPDGLGYEEWEQIGTRLRRIERAIQWLIGDWWNYGERQPWSEDMSQAVDGLDYETVTNYAWVARRFERSRRRDHVSFAHHSEVAKLPAEEADELLDRADPQTNESGTPMRRDAFRVMVRNHNLRHGNVTVESRPVSVIESDAEALVTLIGLHAPPQPRILDVTYNTGAMWNGTPFGPTRMDINPTFKDMGLCDITADCRAMPFDDESYEVIVFDPPHITDAGSDSVMGQRYGSLEGDNISEIFQPFLQEAHRVLTPDGIVLVKICDAVHAGRHQWQHVDLLEDAWALDFTACDVQIKVNRHDPVEGNWLTVRHVRNAHAFWIVLRKGDNCDRGGFDVAQSRQPPTVLP